MDNNGLTTGDLALMRGNNDWGNGGSFMWIFALLLLMFGVGGNGFNRGPGDYVTGSEMTAGFNNQNVQSQLQQIAQNTSNNNYETAQLITGQTNAIMQQNNTNLINAIQGFNSVVAQLQNQTNVLQQQMMALSAQQNECCCSIKTMMLENRLQDEQIRNSTLRNDISNLQQSQYILGQTGRYVAWAGSGAQTLGTT